MSTKFSDLIKRRLMEGMEAPYFVKRDGRVFIQANKMVVTPKGGEVSFEYYWDDVFVFWMTIRSDWVGRDVVTMTGIQMETELNLILN